MRYIYNFFLCLILPFLPLRFLWRSRKNKAYRKHLLERFGFLGFQAIKESIWVHAVSLGESIAAVPLIKEMLKQYPGLPIVVTTMTPTGAQAIKKNFPNQVIHLYVPFDYPFVVKRFLNQINPKILIIMETELWPNILYYTAKRNVPIILNNARLSDRSFAGYKKVRKFMQPVLDCITMVLAQSELDGERFLKLGLKPKKLLVTGNIKFDIEISEASLAKAGELRSVIGQERPVWVAASTHKNEEEKVLVAAKKLLEILPDALLILVPRHPERFDFVFDLCESQGFNTVKYSNIKEYTNSTNIILGDVMGQMLMFYGACDLAFVGGSLIPWGGHNLLEPAALAKPVLSGPHLSSFVAISQMLDDARGLVVANDEKALAEKLIELFQDEKLRESLGQAALNVVESYRGATKKTLKIIEKLVV